MCQYRRLVYACYHFSVGRCVRVCDAQHRREAEADLKGEEAAPCEHYSFHPIHSIGTPQLCQLCECEKERTNALILRARHVISGLRMQIGQKGEAEGKNADRTSNCSLNIADAIPRDAYPC